MERLFNQEGFSALDLHFARFICKLEGTDNPSLFLAAALTSHATGQGHVCCDVSALAGKGLPPDYAVKDPPACPDLEVWQASLRETSVVGRPGDFRPLILDEYGRLYLYRYWQYENDLAKFILRAGSEAAQAVNRALLQQGLRRYFADDCCGEPDWQRVAAFVAVTRRFCVISGGPGTGKTHTIAKILTLLVEQSHGKPVRLAMTAPTGKAAARLAEALRSARQELDCPETIKAAVPEGAFTLHRLLGKRPDSPYFRHDAKNPLNVDAVIVDEASMVDLALMAKLVRALPPAARLILLGDKDQLASVEAGSVLGDICDTGNVRISIAGSGGDGECASTRDRNVSAKEPEVSAVSDCIVELRKSYRFGIDSGIGAVSYAIKEGDGRKVLALLQDRRFRDLNWMELPPVEKLAGALRNSILKGFSDYLQASGFHEKSTAFERFRILCAVRQGPFGVLAMNRLVEDILREARLIQAGQWYPCRPIMITTNDYNLKLFNGDIGIVLSDGQVGGESELEGLESGTPEGMHVYFHSPGSPLRRFSPARLPAHETAYAMTVHKSQGSEFQDVLLLLPDRESPVLTRELLYTGVTRARAGVSVWGRETILLSAVARRIQRSSGLRDAIWGTEKSGEKNKD